MFVCPVPKILQVMIKWRRLASHLDRFTLCHNSCRATQLGKVTLWHNQAELHISVDILCGRTAAELHNSVDLLCDTTASELHNSVNLLCGTTAAELNPVWCMHQESQTFSKDSDEPFWKIWRLNPKWNLTANFWKINALDDSANTDRCKLYESKIQQTF